MIALANQSELLSGHLLFAGLLSLTFALVTVAYVVAAVAWARRLTRAQVFLLHTLYLGWQTNIAFMAVIVLSVAHGIVQQHPMLLQAGWRMAPWVPLSAAILYVAILCASLAFWWQLKSSDA